MTITDDVAIILGRELTSDEQTRAARLVEIATASLESALPGIAISPATEVATVYAGDQTGVWTPRYPLRALNGVSVAGNTVTELAWTEKGHIDFTVTLLNTWELNLPVWAPGSWPVTIDYDYGLTELPADVSAAIATPIANVLRYQATNPDSIQAETLGPYQVAYGDWSIQQAAAGVAAPILARSWKRTIVTSVALVPDTVFAGGFQSSTVVGS